MKKNQQIIIAVVGMPGAGKTTTCDFFRKKGIPVLRFGDETDKGLIDSGKPLTEENERWYREKLRKELGMEAYAIKIKPRIKEALKDNNLVVLDGLRSWEEYIYLKKYFPSLLILAIYTTSKIRYHRMMVRKLRPTSGDKARERDIAELVNLNMGGPIALADYLIKNEEEQNCLHKALEELLSKWQ